MLYIVTYRYCMGAGVGRRVGRVVSVKFGKLQEVSFQNQFLLLCNLDATKDLVDYFSHGFVFLERGTLGLFSLEAFCSPLFALSA